MADYVWWDAKTGRYVLGPPLLTGSEASNWRTTCNSTVELSYWFYGSAHGPALARAAGVAAGAEVG